MELNRAKPLSVFGLVMINVIAICSLRTLPFSAQFGSYIIPVYLLAALGFLLPITAISSFFASRFPEKGGIYIWVRQTLGLKLGFMAIWLQWLYNLLWYPTAMVFIVETFFYGLGMSINRFELVLITTSLFWLITIANCFGMRISSIISIVGALVGSLLPIIVLIILAILIAGNTHPVTLEAKHQWSESLPLVVNIVFGLMGIEMSCVHANDVTCPEKSYPKALMISCLLIVVMLASASTAIAFNVPIEQLTALKGVNQAFSIMLAHLNFGGVESLLLALIAFGGLACIGAWVIGPTKGLFVAGTDGCLPGFFQETNSALVPQRLLILQAIIVSCMNLFYLYMPSLEQAYVTLSIATSQLAIVAYLVLIYAGFKIRNTKITGYELPGGRKVYTAFCIIGFIFSFCIFFLGFKVPPSINVPMYKYDFWLIFGMLSLISPVFFLSKRLR